MSNKDVSRVVKSQQEVDDERNLAATNVLGLFIFGSIWWVSNKLWRVGIPGFVEKVENGEHPGISIACRKFESLMQTVPMLFGSHSNTQGFKVSIRADNRDETRFVMRPQCKFPIKHGFGASRMMRQNDPLMLEDQKRVELKEYLAQRGIRYDD